MAGETQMTASRGGSAIVDATAVADGVAKPAPESMDPSVMVDRLSVT